MAEREMVLIGPRGLPERSAMVRSCASMKARAGSSPSRPPTSALGTEGTLTAFYGNPRQVFVTGTVKF